MKSNEQNRNKFRYGEQTDSCQGVGEMRVWVKKVKGLRQKEKKEKRKNLMDTETFVPDNSQSPGAHNR